MLKHIIVLVLFSALLGFAMPYMHQAQAVLLEPYRFALNILANVFSPGTAGNILHQLIAMLCMPLIVSFIPALPYWLIRRDFPRFFISLVWILWLLQTGALLSVQA